MCVCLGISIENGCIYVHKEVKLGNKIIWAVDPLLSPKRPLVRYSMFIDIYSEIDLIFLFKACLLLMNTLLLNKVWSDVQ